MCCSSWWCWAPWARSLIFDPLQEIDRLEAEAVRLEEQSQAAQAQLADYPEVLERYTRYAPTQEELSPHGPDGRAGPHRPGDPPAAEISQVTIQDQQALVTFSGVTLVETAGLVAQAGAVGAGGPYHGEHRRLEHAI